AARRAAAGAAPEPGGLRRPAPPGPARGQGAVPGTRARGAHPSQGAPVTHADRDMLILLGGVIALLSLVTVVGLILNVAVREGPGRPGIDNLIERTRSF